MLFQIDWPRWVYYIFIALDILAVAFIAYKLILYLFNTKTRNIFKALLLIGVIFFLAHVLKLTTILWVFEKTFAILPLAVLIIFHPEIRRVLVNIGTPKFFMKFVDTDDPEEVIGRIFSAMGQLSQRKIGALITLQQEVGLNTIKDKAVKLNADITEQLLISIFIPTSPLHDGSIIIKGDKLLVARAFFPITEERIAPHLGSRHRAAIGISEHSDAIALVVSEETGFISLAHQGKIYYNVGLEQGKEKVFEILGYEIES